VSSETQIMGVSGSIANFPQPLYTET